MGGDNMELIGNHKLPLFMIGLSILVSVILLILPIDQILVTYKVVNGVKSIVYVTKPEGVCKLLAASMSVNFMWIFTRRKNRHNRDRNPDLFSYRLRGGAMNLFFASLALLPPIAGIISIVTWLVA